MELRPRPPDERYTKTVKAAAPASPGPGGKPPDTRVWLLEFRLLLLIVLGYAYLIFVICLACALTLVHPFFWGITIPILVILFRSVFIRVTPPGGMPIGRAQAPRLFQEIDRLAALFGTRTFDEMRISREFNAAVAQMPLFGLVGWHKTYLLAGLPLMEALTPEQFRAVLAHEFCHLFGGHNRFGSWMLRVSLTWRNIHVRAKNQRPRGDFLVMGFARWYVPLLDRAESRLSHASEHVADRFAADYVGAEAAGGALTSMELKGRYLQSSFWHGIYARARDLPEPPLEAWQEFRDLVRQPFRREWSQKTLGWLMRAGPEENESHPSLPSRMRTMGAEPRLPEAIEESAADYYLAPCVAELRLKLSQHWQTEAREFWHSRHKAALAEREKLATLESKRAETPLTPLEMVEQAVLTGNLRGENEAAPLYTALLESHGDAPLVQYHAGRNLLLTGNGAGIALVEKAMQGNPEYIGEGCDLIVAYLNAIGEMDRAPGYLERAAQRAKVVAEGEAQVRLLTTRAELAPHGLNAKSVEAMASILAGFPQIGRAYCVRRKIAQLPNRVYYCVCFDWRLWSWVRNEGVLLQRIASAFHITDGLTLFFSIGSDWRLRRHVQRVPGSCVYKQRMFGRPAAKPQTASPPA